METIQAHDCEWFNELKGISFRAEKGVFPMKRQTEEKQHSSSLGESRLYSSAHGKHTSDQERLKAKPICLFKSQAERSFWSSYISSTLNVPAN